MIQSWFRVAGLMYNNRQFYKDPAAAGHASHASGDTGAPVHSMTPPCYLPDLVIHRFDFNFDFQLPEWACAY